MWTGLSTARLVSTLLQVRNADDPARIHARNIDGFPIRRELRHHLPRGEHVQVGNVPEPLLKACRSLYPLIRLNSHLAPIKYMAIIASRGDHRPHGSGAMLFNVCCRACSMTTRSPR